MFERFTDRARKVMALSNETAQSSNAPCIDTEHILLGLFRETNGMTARILTEAGLKLEEVREKITKLRVDQI